MHALDYIVDWTKVCYFMSHFPHLASYPRTLLFHVSGVSSHTRFMSPPHNTSKGSNDSGEGILPPPCYNWVFNDYKPFPAKNPLLPLGVILQT